MAKKTSSTTRNTKTKLGLTLQPAASTYPIAYSEDTWDVIDGDSEIVEFLDGEGQYDQHEINEALATAIKNNAGTALPSGLMRIAGTVTVPEGQELERALHALDDTAEQGDVYLYHNANENLTEEWVCIKTETESGGVTTVTTDWQLVGIKQNTLHAVATLIDGTSDEYEITLS